MGFWDRDFDILKKRRVYSRVKIGKVIISVCRTILAKYASLGRSKLMGHSYDFLAGEHGGSTHADGRIVDGRFAIAAY